ncbi:hypothetical protein [Sporosarcina sp. FSL K6-5500]|uniref:hypothetical protein n=1 Tax=Sporosarcina sp. FSL K6-5500 TaxID=2921558 RepID=UPI0030FBD55F
MYFLNGIDEQADKGFGILGDAFVEAADQLYKSKENSFLAHIHMPIGYLYRHAIELHLKSMIVIFHEQLEIPYGESSDKPQILLKDGRWRNIDDCHWLNALYWYWSKLINDNREKLEEIAAEGSWLLNQKWEAMIDEIHSYDKDSSYFRYPFVKKDDKNRDAEKFLMQEVDGLENLEVKDGGVYMVYTDQPTTSGEINAVKIYSHKKGTLDDLIETAHILSNDLKGFHIMMRHTLCGGK